MPHRSFTPRPGLDDPITFDVAGEKFTATPKAPAGLYLEMVANGETIGYTGAQSRFIEDVLEPEETTGGQVDRLVVEAIRGVDPAATVEDRAAAIVASLRGAGVLREPRSRWELAMGTLLDPADVKEIFDYLIGTYADRPTEPPAG